MSNINKVESTAWSPNTRAVWLKPTGAANPTTVLLQHPRAPFLESLSDGSHEAELQAAALRYLNDVNPRFELGLPAHWLADRGAWAPIGGARQGYWFASFWFERKDAEESLVDRTVILSMSDPPGDECADRGFGVRVVAHVGARNAQGYEMRITGMSARLPLDDPASAIAPPVSTPGGPGSPAGAMGRPTEVWGRLGTNLGRTMKMGMFHRELEKLLRQSQSTPELLQQSDSRGNFLFQIMNSRFVQKDKLSVGKRAGGVKRVTASRGKKKPSLVSVEQLLSNDLTARAAFVHLDDFFKRLTEYGIDPMAYFRCAQLPLKVEYRSGTGTGPGRDGQTVNARVERTWQPGDKPWPRGEAGRPSKVNPELKVHLALGNLSHRERKPWNRKDRSPAEPMGIGVDQRWMWHEIGHVLLMASTGELEHRFAHSPGDALAAIVADPHTDPEWRGATFPLVFMPRRHDRCVRKGWSWCGTTHEALRQLPERRRTRHKGYRAEQILSSSLFRLYLCLGGATTGPDGSKPDHDAREDASHYAIFLIIKGLNLLGNALLVPANYPEQLVAALIDADVGTEWFDRSGRPRRVGGCAHKAIRWAFEAQGLYAADPKATSNEPGAPEAVDIYIGDRRDLEEHLQNSSVGHGPGSYVPVSLHWPETLEGFSWLADQKSITLEDDNIFVRVGNRGTERADNVAVRVWRREYRDRDEPLWNDGTWTEIKGPSKTRHIEPDADVEADAHVKFGPFPFTPASGKRYLLLAETTCDADRANSDPVTGLPCSREKTPLADLVANDNNLGLVVVPYP